MELRKTQKKNTKFAPDSSKWRSSSFGDVFQSLCTVGSQVEGEYSLVCRDFISSSSSSKSNTFAFSLMRSGLTDLGSGINPCDQADCEC